MKNVRGFRQSNKRGHSNRSKRRQKKRKTTGDTFKGKRSRGSKACDRGDLTKIIARGESKRWGPPKRGGAGVRDPALVGRGKWGSGLGNKKNKRITLRVIIAFQVGKTGGPGPSH